MALKKKIGPDGKCSWESDTGQLTDLISISVTSDAVRLGFLWDDGAGELVIRRMEDLGELITRLEAARDAAALMASAMVKDPPEEKK